MENSSKRSSGVPTDSATTPALTCSVQTCVRFELRYAALLRRHSAKSGTGHPGLWPGGPPVASQPPDAGHSKAHARPSSSSGHVTWSTSDTATGFLLSFLSSQTTCARLHGNSRFLGHLCVYNICIVWAPREGPRNQHGEAEGTSFLGGLCHRPERRGPCVNGMARAGVGGAVAHPRNRIRWAGGRRSPAGREGSTRDLGWSGRGHTNRVSRDVSRLKTSQTVLLLLLLCLCFIAGGFSFDSLTGMYFFSVLPLPLPASFQVTNFSA